MNNKKQVDNTEDKPAVGSASEAASQSKAQGKTPKPSTGRGWRLLSVFLLLVIMAGVGYLGWAGQRFLLHLHGLDNRFAQREALIDSFGQDLERLSLTQSQQISTYTQDFKALQLEQQRQLQLLEQSDNSGRDKHLLDEAEFLIRLANQRLLVERRPQGAQALLESADEVLAKVDDPRLLSLRKTLGENIAELRRTAVIDREGIYLRIEILADLMMTFSALPAHGLQNDQVSNKNVAAGVDVDTQPAVVAAPWYQRLWENISAGAQGFVSRHFHVRSLEQPMAPLMSVSQETQLRQSLLITLGNAQQAVLREEAGIYRASLIRAGKDISQYFVLNEDTQAIIEQLLELQSEAVKQALPDISASLNVLRDYRAASAKRFGNGEG